MPIWGGLILDMREEKGDGERGGKNKGNEVLSRDQSLEKESVEMSEEKKEPWL